CVFGASVRLTPRDLGEEGSNALGIGTRRCNGNRVRALLLASASGSCRLSDNYGLLLRPNGSRALVIAGCRIHLCYVGRFSVGVFCRTFAVARLGSASVGSPTSTTSRRITREQAGPTCGEL